MACTGLRQPDRLDTPKEVNPMTTTLKTIATKALLIAGPVAFLVIETAGWRGPS